MTTRTDILDKMEKVRKELGWSQESVARHLDVSVGTYQRWEYGNAEPNFENTIKIQDFIEEHEKKTK